MSLYGDYCPYCDGELEPDDVVELSDLRGEEEDIQTVCKHCYRNIRAHIYFEPVVLLKKEEDRIDDIKQYKKRLLQTETDYPDYSWWVPDEIKRLDRDIEESKKLIDENNEMEKLEE